MEQLSLPLNRETKPCSISEVDTTLRFKRSMLEAFGPYSVLTLEEPPPSRLECLFSQRLSKGVMAIMGAGAVGSFLLVVFVQGVRAYGGK